jgi:hypothetical protein
LLFESRDDRMSTIPGAPHAHKRAAGLMQTEAARILARPVMTVDPSIVTFSAPAGDPPPPEAAVLVHGGGPVNQVEGQQFERDFLRSRTAWRRE